MEILAGITLIIVVTIMFLLASFVLVHGLVNKLHWSARALLVGSGIMLFVSGYALILLET